MKFRADSVKVVGPNKDGGLTITFGTSQDQQHEVALLLGIPQQKSMWVDITPFNKETIDEPGKITSRFD